jgi:hypothetical protein
MTLADLFRRFDALPLEIGRHPDVRHDHLWREPIRAGHELVVIRRDAYDLEVVLEREQRSDSFAGDQVVVGEEDTDPLVHSVILSRETSPGFETVEEIARLAPRAES